VETFADGTDDCDAVLRGVDVLVVGPAAPEVGGAVHQPRHVQCPTVPQHTCDEVGVPIALTPQDVGYDCGQHEAEDENELEIVFLLEAHEWVLKQVFAAHVSALFDDIGMFATQQPSAVREEEASVGVVGVGVRLAVLVVHPMVATPLVD